MAAFSGLNLSNLKLGSCKIEASPLVPLPGLKDRKHGVLILSQRPARKLIGCRCSSSAQSAQIHSGDGFKENEPLGSTRQVAPNAVEVESLLEEICDTTSIAEFELKFGGFRLYVSRDLSGKNEAPQLPVSAPVTSTAVSVPELNGSATSTSLAISKPALTSGGIQSFLDRAGDDGLVILPSPKVGYFRRCRTIKGKRAPPACKEKQTVKEGQVLCFIEQLGGEIPIESETSGEVIRILREDGDPVGYGDALIAILPSFPGIKKLQ
ncbi:hypothetical protein ACET3Z_026683 [Daucus carota]